MNVLLPYKFKDTPTHIFESVAQGVIERHLLDTVVTSVQGDVPLDPGFRARLAWRHQLVAELISSQVLSMDDVTAMVSSATHAMNIVFRKPHLLSLWQDRLLATAETAEQLFWLNKSIPPADRADISDETIVEAIKHEPTRLLRVTLRNDQHAAEALDVEITRGCNDRRYENPSWAIEWLSRHHVNPRAALDPKLTAVLSQSEWYTYLAIRVLRDRVYDPITWRELETAIISPRWAYHLLCDNLACHQKARLEEVLLSHPGWTSEYLVDRECTPEKVRNFYMRSVEKSFAHELVGDLHHWMRTMTVMRLIKKGNQLAAAS